MKKLFLYSFILLMAVACSDNKKNAEILLSVADAKDSSMVVISKLDINTVVPVDTLYTIHQKASYGMNCTEGSPEFIYVSVGGNLLASLVLLPGDKISVSVGSDKSVSISGSEESLLMQGVQHDIRKFQSEFDSLSTLIIAARNEKNAKLEKELSRSISSLYVARKREAVKYLYRNIKSITTIPVMYQKVSSELPIFAETSDVIIFKKVYDSLQPLFPNSPYLIALNDEITARENNLALINKLNNVEVVDFPNITLPDINSKERTLSDYKGKVIVLLFWTIADENQAMFNADLKALYDKYSYMGVEIYQVSLDSDKTAWATMVKDQDLGWVSVCDISGSSSVYAMMYNVTKLPSMFIFSKDGQIVDKDVFDIKKLEQVLVREFKK